MDVKCRIFCKVTDETEKLYVNCIFNWVLKNSVYAVNAAYFIYTKENGSLEILFYNTFVK